MLEEGQTKDLISQDYEINENETDNGMILDKYPFQNK